MAKTPNIWKIKFGVNITDTAWPSAQGGSRDEATNKLGRIKIGGRRHAYSEPRANKPSPAGEGSMPRNPTMDASQ